MMPDRKDPLSLPAPRGALTVEAVSAVPPGTQRLVLHDVNFALDGWRRPRHHRTERLGEIVAGASYRRRLALRRRVKSDLMAPHSISGHPRSLGPHIGYLPQNVELFDGTVADNISRFEARPTQRPIIAAARAAGVHDHDYEASRRLRHRDRRRRSESFGGPTSTDCAR